MNLLELKSELAKNQVSFKLKPDNEIAVIIPKRIPSRRISDGVSTHKKSIIAEWMGHI